ncbi:trehalose-6-phosphate hydrolase, putative [Entamoeba invadens IP1]|uniref:Trehalose-6-phosphate hydrolase, putative n=1 Tax=Entamoeba invadens IP1 TaxID=370355 RepID=A0A0A1TY23_ENTIV|nr:trehalose-6-phosphate hydrolase, putative [Entamoeba invadens IP1]ELP83411.1 trehalose-6-phosphate hydrolase, putative [Entamoeba invadens IP1]|eukprot:XP_004182757.1 trehalose-6-phosphate hydrolase, putative [Entamoeba invadens IP1]
MSSEQPTRCWWKEGVVYQIYCRSFKDTTGNGFGDLDGIISKIPYLQDLGVTIVWLNPIYASPDADNGYDISDYYSISSKFGDMKKFDELLSRMHSAGIKVVMDLVVNHTSSEHPWFKASVTGEGDKKDYYIWSKETNDWRTFFSQSAWEYNATRQEYYLHLFAKGQPDLNWENSSVRSDVYKMMNWWFEKGIDGFRMDVINMISKVIQFPTGGVFLNGPKIHDYLQEMNTKVLSKYDCFTVGEMPGVDSQLASLYTSPERKELQMVFQFEHVSIGYQHGDKWAKGEWKLTELKKCLMKWQSELHGRGWNSLYLNNHDQPRQVSRWGDDQKYRVESAKMLATMLHTLEGTPYIYQGEEIGMTNFKVERIEDIDDCETLGRWEEIQTTHQLTLEQFLERASEVGRDNARTPMQWDETENAGFTHGKPWLRVNPNYKEINVKKALEDKDSIFYYYQKLLKLRKENSIMVYGVTHSILDENESIFAYTRSFEEKTWLIILNFFGQETLFEAPENLNTKNHKLIISNYQVDNEEDIQKFILKPYEARVYSL